MSNDPTPPSVPKRAEPTTAPQNTLEFGTHLAAMTHPPIAEIRRYWNTLRAGRMMPLRSEVDPRDMPSILECCFILDQRNVGDIRFRLAGMALNDLMGMELRGMHMRSLIEPPERATFSATLEKMFETPEIQEFELRSIAPNAPPLSGRMLVLPLKGPKGHIDRAMGCLVTTGIVGIAPRRLSVDRVIRTSLQTGAQVRQEEGQPCASGRAATGFAEEAALFDFTPSQKKNGTPTGVPYLRIVK